MGSGRWRCRVLNIRAVPATNVVIWGLDFLGGQHSDRGHRDVLILRLSVGGAGAERVLLPAEGEGMQLDDALAAEPVPHSGAAAAKVASRKVAVVAYVAR